jgi:hypothetical protein
MDPQTAYPDLPRCIECVTIQHHNERCWVWGGPVDRDGYPRCTVNGRQVFAHRFFYSVMVAPIPEGLDIHHLCHNRRCVSPAHLTPATRRENVHDSTSPAADNSRKTHCIHGHLFSPDNTCRRRDQRFCRTCDRERKQRKRNSRGRGAG